MKSFSFASSLYSSPAPFNPIPNFILLLCSALLHMFVFSSEEEKKNEIFYYPLGSTLNLRKPRHMHISTVNHFQSSIRFQLVVPSYCVNCDPFEVRRFVYLSLLDRIYGECRYFFPHNFSRFVFFFFVRISTSFHSLLLFCFYWFAHKFNVGRISHH